MEAEIGPEELEDAGATLVDVRRDDEWETGHIAGAVHIPLPELQERAGEIDDPVIFYCKIGDRSGMAAEAFRASGREAASLTGGIEAWQAAGRPVDA
jgi:rhodanese-related sulfurtransferase